VDESGRTLDLEDVNRAASRNDQVLVIRAGRPFLPADPDKAAVPADLLQHLGRPANQCRRTGPEQRGLRNVPSRDGPDEAEARTRGTHEGEQLDGQRQANGPSPGSHDSAHGDDAERERGSHQLGHAEYGGHDQPDNPCGHDRSEQRLKLV